MNYLFEISKEHKTLPKSEIISILKSKKIGFEVIESNEDVLIINSNINENTLKKIAERLAYTFYLDKFLFSSSPSIKEIKKLAISNSLKIKGTIAIKYKNRSKTIDSQTFVKCLAEIYSKNRLVNLEDPEIELRVFINEKKIYVGLKILRINRTQYEERKVQNRPFFSPISLHPKLARALVNLSLIKSGETILDPFCGTGGILIEAGLIGAKIIGNDIEEKMINGCKKTFDFYEIKNYKLFCNDVGDIKNTLSKVDAIVTDLPYGKSTTTKGEKMEDLYNRAFKEMSYLLKENKIAVVGLSDRDLIYLGEKYFRLENTYKFKVHRSLRRYFVVFKK